MLLGLGYLHKFVMFYLSFFKKQKTIDLKKPVRQNFVILYDFFVCASNRVGRSRRPTN